MSLIQSKYAKGLVPIPYPAFAGAVVALRFSHQLTAAPVADDILELACIPAGCRVVDMVLDSDDLDSDGTPAIAFDVGIMSGDFGDNDDTRTCGAEFFSASTVGQAGTVARPTIKTAFRTSSSATERSIGIKFTTAADVFVAGTVGLTVFLATE